MIQCQSAAETCNDDGPTRFARFAYPPNLRGLCGPPDASAFAELASAPPSDELRHTLRSFEGAYPYLELLAGAAGTDDPLQPDVVEAYWLGNELLQRVTPHDLARSMDDRFRRRSGRHWTNVAGVLPFGVANHAFHVLVLSPWVGLLRDGVVDEPLAIVDQCRISWGLVIESNGGNLLVERVPMRWVDGHLRLCPAERSVANTMIAAEPGDVVALHWGWVCEVLAPRQLWWLRTVTAGQLALLDRMGVG